MRLETILSLTTLVALLAGCGGSSAPGPSAQPTPTPTPVPPPNLALIVMDDLDGSSGDLMARMPSLMYDHGPRFTNMITTTPLCAPSRASFLTGQYAHNHTIFGNGPPLGAYEIFRDRGYDSATVGSWLQGAGYRTVLLGKYMNNFPLGDDSFIPPGWDEWFGVLSDRHVTGHDYTLNENGAIVTYRGEESYQTDELSDKLVDFVERAEANDSQPFFAYLGIHAPHGPALPARRHDGAFDGERAPRVPSFNEGDISDKPAWLRRAPLLDGGTISAIDARYRARQETLLSVEDLIADLVDVLTRTGELGNTWIFVTSDNGVMHGQHRMSGGKGIVYDESIAVPLSVRGPGTTGSQVIEEIVANIDFVPTLLELAGAAIPDSVDGRSFAPLLRGTASDWRNEVLIQSAGTGAPLQSPAFTGVRSRDYVFAEYAGGERELYSLGPDPFQLDNRMRLGADSAVVDQLAARLAALRGCVGQACRDN